ncbi:MAG: AAA family ATPase, partial [Promethearchaeota archaeon]
MTKIYFIGDTHFGKSYPYRKDYSLNISERNLDVIDNCEKIILSAIKDQADYVIFLGDLYDRKMISPTIRKIVREKIFVPLNKHNINTIIIGGNHDSVRSPKRGVDIQELSSFSNVEVYTNLHSQVIERNGTKLGFIFLPYIRFEVLVNVAKEKGLLPDAESTGKDDYILAQTILEQYIKNICENKLKNCDKRILMGHYYLDGAKIRETNNPSAIYGEFKFTKSMIQKDHFDLVIFGHLHLQQTVWDNERIIIPGSVDRIDFGERDSNKFYCTYDVEDDLLGFHEIECRTLLKETIEIPDDTADLTQYILEHLPKKEEINNSVCKISIIHPKAQEIKIDKKQIEGYFQIAFYADISYSEKATEELKKLREVNLDPLSLYHQFLDQHYKDNHFYKDLKEIGTDLLQKQLFSVDIAMKGDISIKSISLQNFNKYGKGPNKIEFGKSLYVIKGPTGSGKSSILDAITYALFKRSTRKDAGLNIDEILYKDGYVILEIFLGDKLVTIKRKQTTPKLEIKLEGETLYTGLNMSEKEKRLENMIGYDYEAFTSSFFIRQQELQIFSSLIPSERHKRLIKLFKLGIFVGIYKNLKNRIDEFIAKHNILEGQILGLKTRVEDLPEKQQKLRNKNEELGTIEQEREVLSKLVDTLRKDVEKLQVDATNYVNAQSSIDELKTKIEQSNSEVKSYRTQQEDYSKLQKELSELKDFRKEKQNLETCKENTNKMAHKKELLESQIINTEKLLTQTINQYATQIENLTKEVKEKEARLLNIGSSMSKEMAFQSLKDDGRLTERLERIRQIEIPLAREYNDQKRVEEFSLLMTKTANDLEILQPKIQGITQDIFLVEELKNEENKMRDQIKEIEGKQQEECNQLKVDMDALHKECRLSCFPGLFCGFGHGE